MISATKLNEALKAAPECIVNLLLHRVPMPEALSGIVPSRDDGTISALGILNKLVLSNQNLVAQFVDDPGGQPAADKCVAFSVEDSGSAQVSRASDVAGYFISQELFDILWKSAIAYAPADVQQHIQDIANANSDTVPDKQKFCRKPNKVKAQHKVYSAKEESDSLYSAFKQLQSVATGVTTTTSCELMADQIVPTIEDN